MSQSCSGDSGRCAGLRLVAVKQSPEAETHWPVVRQERVGRGSGLFPARRGCCAALTPCSAGMHADVVPILKAQIEMQADVLRSSDHCCTARDSSLLAIANPLRHAPPQMWKRVRTVWSHAAWSTASVPTSTFGWRMSEWICNTSPLHSSSCRHALHALKGTPDSSIPDELPIAHACRSSPMTGPPHTHTRPLPNSLINTSRLMQPQAHRTRLQPTTALPMLPAFPKQMAHRSSMPAAGPTPIYVAPNRPPPGLQPLHCRQPCWRSSSQQMASQWMPRQAEMCMASAPCSEFRRWATPKSFGLVSN